MSLLAAKKAELEGLEVAEQAAWEAVRDTPQWQAWMSLGVVRNKLKKDISTLEAVDELGLAVSQLSDVSQEARR